jgi:NAD(P)H-binding
VKLAVLGATGSVGRELVTQALEAGHEVSALVRRQPKPGELDDRVALVLGDAKSAEAVERAVAGSKRGVKPQSPPRRRLAPQRRRRETLKGCPTGRATTSRSEAHRPETLKRSPTWAQLTRFRQSATAAGPVEPWIRWTSGDELATRTPKCSSGGKRLTLEAMAQQAPA